MVREGWSYPRVTLNRPADEILIGPFEYDETDERIAITGLGFLDEFGQDEGIDTSTPSFATIHSRTTLSMGFILCLRGNRMSASSLRLW